MKADRQLFLQIKNALSCVVRDRAFSLSVPDQAHDRTADAANDVGQVRNVACGEQAAEDFLRQVEHGDGNQCQGDFARAAAGGGCEEDQHVDDGRGTQKHRAAAEEDMEQTGDKRSNCEHKQKTPASVAFFNNRAECEDERHVGNIMRK